VPVPLHPRRQWQRGFNQAEALAAHLRQPVWRVLCRRRPTRAQASLHAGDRARNVDGAFALAPLPAARGLAAWINLLAPLRATGTARGIAGRVLVLVDDVSTTGATLEACARVLGQAGAREVRAITAARAVLARR
jgi:predicted amidophosphoribosyltransferase